LAEGFQRRSLKSEKLTDPSFYYVQSPINIESEISSISVAYLTFSSIECRERKADDATYNLLPTKPHSMWLRGVNVGVNTLKRLRRRAAQ
jgi:hypothetical protein